MAFIRQDKLGAQPDGEYVQAFQKKGNTVQSGYDSNAGGGISMADVKAALKPLVAGAPGWVDFQNSIDAW